jgi:hypothetical protein
MRSSNNLEIMNPKNIKKAGDFKDDDQATVYKANIIENLEERTDYWAKRVMI